MNTANTHTGSDAPKGSFITRITRRISRAIKKIRASEPLEPIITKLFERPSHGFWLGCAIVICITGSTYFDFFTQWPGPQPPMALLFVVLLMNGLVNIAVLPLSSSFRSFLSLHCLGMALALGYLLLVITQSPYLTVLLGVVFAIVGTERAGRESVGDASPWQYARLLVTIVFLFVAAGHYVFDYSQWLYKFRFFGLPFFETKDALLRVYFCMVLLISFIQSLWAVASYFYSTEKDVSRLPPGTIKIESFRRACGDGAEALAGSTAPYNSNSFARLSASAKKGGLVLLGGFLKALQLPALIILICVGAVTYSFSILLPRNLLSTIAGLLPVVFIISSVALSVRLGGAAAQHPNFSSEFMSHGLFMSCLLMFGIVAAALFAFCNFRAFHMPKAAKVEIRHQRLEQVMVCIFVWPFFCAFGVFVSQWWRHGEYDSPSGKWLAVQSAVIVVMWILHDLLVRGSERNETPRATSYSSGGIAAGHIAALVVVVFVSTTGWAQPALLAWVISLVVLLGLLLASVEPKKSRWKPNVFGIAIAADLCSLGTALVMTTHNPPKAIVDCLESQIYRQLSAPQVELKHTYVLSIQVNSLRKQLWKAWDEDRTYKRRAAALKSALEAIQLKDAFAGPDVPDGDIRIRPDPFRLNKAFIGGQTSSLELNEIERLHTPIVNAIVISVRVSHGADATHGNYVQMASVADGDTASTFKHSPTSNDSLQQIDLTRIPSTPRWNALAFTLALEMKRELATVRSVTVYWHRDGSIYAPLGFIIGPTDKAAQSKQSQLSSTQDLFPTFFPYDFTP